MNDTVDRWRNMTKTEIAAVDVGTLWNTIDDLCDEIERLESDTSSSVQRLQALGKDHGCPLGASIVGWADGEIKRLRTANTELVNAIGNWWGDGSWDDDEHEGHASWCDYADDPRECICGRSTVDSLEAHNE